MRRLRTPTRLSTLMYRLPPAVGAACRRLNEAVGCGGGVLPLGEPFDARRPAGRHRDAAVVPGRDHSSDRGRRAAGLDRPAGLSCIGEGAMRVAVVGAGAAGAAAGWPSPVAGTTSPSSTAVHRPRTTPMHSRFSTAGRGRASRSSASRTTSSAVRVRCCATTFPMCTPRCWQPVRRRSTRPRFYRARTGCRVMRTSRPSRAGGQCSTP